jgi:RNA recognition motif-containing protein
MNGADDPNRLFVGGLPPQITDADLERYFSRFGELTEVTLKRDPKGRPKGYGFIRFQEISSASDVIAHKADHHIHDKWIDVKVMGDQAEKPEWGAARPSGAAPRMGDDGVQRQPLDSFRTVFVGGLPTGIQEAELYTHFSAYGDVEDIDEKKDPSTGRPKGFAFVTFVNEEAQRRCLLQPKQVLQDTVVEVKPYEKSVRGRQGPSHFEWPAADTSAGPSIFVGGLPSAATADDIGRMMAS